MEYKIIKKTRINDNGEDKIYYQIKKKLVFNIWFYFSNADYIVFHLVFNAFSIFFLSMLGCVNELIFSIPTYILLFIGSNSGLNFLLYKANKTVFSTAKDAENAITKIIKKKKHINKEEIVSFIKYDDNNNNLIIEK